MRTEVGEQKPTIGSSMSKVSALIAQHSVLYFGLCAVLFALCSAAGAQQPKKLPRIGILRVGSPPDVFIDTLRQGLHDTGYIEGQNILLEYRWLKREDQFAEAAEDLVRLNADIIVVTSTVGALAARRAT